MRIGKEMGRHIGLPLRNGHPTAVPLFHAYAVYHLHPSPCGKRGDSQEGGKPQVVYPLVRPPRAAATFPHAAACEILCRGYGKPLHRRSAVPLSFQGEASGRCKRFLTTYILWGTQKTEGKCPRFRVLSRDMRRITSSEQPRRPDRCVQ